VLSLVRAHATNAEIGARLHISERTVESHVRSLLQKFGVSDRRHLIAIVDSLETPARRLPAAFAIGPDLAGFVGRHHETAALRDAWDRAVRGRHLELCIVRGEAGIGKTRLVTEVARELHEGGARVLLGSSFEDGSEPFRAFVHLVEADLSQRSDAAVGQLAEGRADALALLSSGIRRRLGVVAETSSVSDRAALVDAVCGWLIDSAREIPLLVVLEDLHWMSSSSRAVVRALVRRGVDSPMLVLATAHDAQPDLDDDLEQLLDDLERLPWTRSLRLTGLSTRDLAQLVELGDEEAEQLRTQSGGNPLLALHATDSGGDGSLRSILAQRDALLEPSAQLVLDLAATLGAEVEVRWLVGEDRGRLAVLESLQAAEEAGWVRPHPDAPARWAFVHPLFRTHRYRSLPLRRRLEMHLLAAAALAGDDGMLSEQARHACLAVPLGDPRTAISLACRAGEAAERGCAYEEAAGHYRRAQDVLSALERPDPSLSLDVRIRLGAALHHAGDPDGLSILLDSAELARRAGDGAAVVRAALAMPHHGAILDPRGDDPRSEQVTTAALRVLGPEPSGARALLLADLACHRAYEGTPEAADAATALAQEALALARRAADPELLGLVLMARRHVTYVPDRLEEFERDAEEMLDLGRSLGSLPLRFTGSFAIAIAHRHRGELDRWRDARARCAALLDGHRQPFFELELLGQDVSDLLLQGALDEVEGLLAEVASLEESVGHRRVWTGVVRSALRRLQHRDDELVDALEHVVRRRRGQPIVRRAMLGAASAHLGDHRRAREVLEELAGERVPVAAGWDVVFSELAEMAEIEHDLRAAHRVIEAVGAHRGRLSAAGPLVGRPYDQMLAQAWLVVDPATAAEVARGAVARSRQLGAVVHLGRELAFLAEAERRCGAATRDVHAHVHEARSIAAATGAGIIRADLDRFGLVDAPAP